MTVTAITVITLRALAVYLAAAVQVTIFPDHGPQLLLVIAAWILCGSASRTGIVWCAVIGLCLDIIANHRLGLHLATCGVLASLAVAVVPPNVRLAFWWRPAIASWLALGDTAITLTLRGPLLQQHSDLRENLQQSLTTSVATAGCVLAAVLGQELLRRCWRSGQSYGRLELNNQWTRLAEN